MERPVYVLMMRAEPGVDDIRALRAWLKIGLRTFGLRCEEIQEGKQQRRTKMDARKYASKYVKPDNVRDGPIQTRIINVFEEERYGRLMLELETGSQFALNDGNTNVLIKAWGHNTDDWIGQEIELLLGHYQDWKEDPPKEKETVKIRAISLAKTAENGGAPVSKPLPPSRVAPSGGGSLRGELDDDVPFCANGANT
jgi:hypothetical protein